jgi:RNA polymerase sigma-54 factor
MQSQKQTLTQQQRLNLSPQLVQSIKLMAMPFADLRDRILEEVEKNPALEIVSDPFDGADPDHDGGKLPTEWKLSSDGRSVDDWSTSAPGAGDEESDEHRDFIEGALHRTETLQEHLLEQLAEIKLPAEVRALGELVIQNLDRDGFHIVSPSELAGGSDERTLAAALDAVRSLEPVGCAATGFQESLAVQARLLARGPLEADPLLARTVDILENHFELLEKGRADALVKAVAKRPELGFSLDLEEAEGVFDLIRSLDPFPGRAFDSSPESWIVPDVIVRKTEEDFSVIINDEEIPVIGVAPFFMELEDSATSGGKSEARDFARESVKEAQWFLHTIERRNRTILKLARALVVFQRDFFVHGPTRLAPLRMKDIAEEIGMHEATVSRAANGKYLQCEWGIFELRHFFSNQVSSGSPGGGGGLFSKEGVKEVIRQIIAESKETLSDQKISDLLAVRGIKIARRTVAKYRGELNLGSSFERV